MSKFLGPIHHWLHHKIMLQERMELRTEAALAAAGCTLDSLASWNEKYGFPNPQEALETVIDSGNIHGWLQRRIGFAETRFAGKLTDLKMSLGESVIEFAEAAATAEAQEAAAFVLENNLWDGSLKMAHKLLHDHILEGMPCDQAGAVTLSEEDRIEWRSDRCLHRGYWEAVDGQVSDHYRIRDAFNQGFFRALDQLNYERSESMGITQYKISRI